MDTSSLTAPGLAQQQNVAQQEASNALISSDFQTFLTMLTAQLENQDPLNPVDSADYAVQLATFSGVEQQVQTNQLLGDLMDKLAVGGLADLAGWVGMEARSGAPASFDGTPVDVHAAPAAYADAARLVVRDAAGRVVQADAIPVQSGVRTWAGVDPSGQPFPAGQYSFEVESLIAGEVVETSPAETYSRIVEIRAQDGQTVLVLGNGATVDSSGVSALRTPT